MNTTSNIKLVISSKTSIFLLRHSSIFKDFSRYLLTKFRYSIYNCFWFRRTAWQIDIHRN
ncbi:NADH dehydrogenase subunit K [Iris pallida]|uniref:NADH dehydrogenase subunit K (Plastid) n=1 Tax=Iris pallida TaxID=29817 RepID=A0AAX6EYL0_IRIPA|nr:NADH dehydrogenase subunit K [Iris pallida]KAJ6809123.1 NADH dehydrogenase subunit K [Iris pallida]